MGRTSEFDHLVTTEAELRELLGHPSEMVVQKTISQLDQHCRNFMAQSPFMLLATANAAGECDVSPRGDAPGFVLILDEKRLVIPERPGNRKLDSLTNIVSNPRVGLLFLMPGMGETLRINGRAYITRDPSLLERMEARGKRPLLGIGVYVEECFLHCAKALKRSQLWQTQSWPASTDLPSAAQIFHDHANLPETTVEQVEKSLEESYRTRLY